MKKPLISRLFCLAVFTTFVFGAYAQGQEELSRNELFLQEQAAKRNYPGGPDEEKIKVLEDVTSATAKLNSYQVEREVYKSLFNEESKSSDKGE